MRELCMLIRNKYALILEVGNPGKDAEVNGNDL